MSYDVSCLQPYPCNPWNFMYPCNFTPASARFIACKCYHWAALGILLPITCPLTTCYTSIGCVNSVLFTISVGSGDNCGVWSNLVSKALMEQTVQRYTPGQKADHPVLMWPCLLPCSTVSCAVAAILNACDYCLCTYLTLAAVCHTLLCYCFLAYLYYWPAWCSAHCAACCSARCSAHCLTLQSHQSFQYCCSFPLFTYFKPTDASDERFCSPEGLILLEDPSWL